MINESKHEPLLNPHPTPSVPVYILAKTIISKVQNYIEPDLQKRVLLLAAAIL